MRRTMYWVRVMPASVSARSWSSSGYGEGRPLGFADVLAGQCRRLLAWGVTPVLGAEQGLQGA